VALGFIQLDVWVQLLDSEQRGQKIVARYVVVKLVVCLRGPISLSYLSYNMLLNTSKPKAKRRACNQNKQTGNRGFNKFNHDSTSTRNSTNKDMEKTSKSEKRRVKKAAAP